MYKRQIILLDQPPPQAVVEEAGHFPVDAVALMVGLVGLGHDEPPLPVVDVVHPLGVRPWRARPVEVHPVATGIVGVDKSLAVVGLSAHPQGLEQLVSGIVKPLTRCSLSLSGNAANLKYLQSLLTLEGKG